MNVRKHGNVKEHGNIQVDRPIRSAPSAFTKPDDEVSRRATCLKSKERMLVTYQAAVAIQSLARGFLGGKTAERVVKDALDP